MKKIRWYHYLVGGFILLFADIIVSTLVYGDSYLRGFLSWVDIMFFVIAFSAIVLITMGIILCHYQVLINKEDEK